MPPLFSYLQIKKTLLKIDCLLCLSIASNPAACWNKTQQKETHLIFF